MTTHILSLTYQPKIDAVKAGNIRQTIRLCRKAWLKDPGDRMLMHTWEGKPYRSKWGWRLDAPITEVYILRFAAGRWIIFNEDAWHPLSDDEVAGLAVEDGIEPSTRQGLESTLKALNHLDTLEGTQWEVIRW